MMVAGFAPIHATASGFGKNQVALLMVSMQLGTILFQLPFGWISDRTDRRYVLIAAAIVVIVAGACREPDAGRAIHLDHPDLHGLGWRDRIDLFDLQCPCQRPRVQGRSGRADEHHAVCLVGIRLHLPGNRDGFDRALGTQAFMYVAVAIGAAFCVFVAWRIRQTPAASEQGNFAPMTAQVPLPAELAFSQDSAED